MKRTTTIAIIIAIAGICWIGAAIIGSAFEFANAQAVASDQRTNIHAQR